MDIMQMKKSDDTPFVPVTTADAVEGLDDKIEEGQAVKSVNGKTGIIDLNADDVSAYSKDETDDLLEDKVSKVSGKDLSTNDYTEIDKVKVSEIDNKQNKILVSPSGSQFILSVSDDGTLTTEPYTEGS